jgi:hypothetical protein
MSTASCAHTKLRAVAALPGSVVVRGRALTDEQVSELAREFTSGKTIAQLETTTDIPHGTIQRALSNAGVQMRPRGFPVR